MKKVLLLLVLAYHIDVSDHTQRTKARGASRLCCYSHRFGRNNSAERVGFAFVSVDVSFCGGKEAQSLCCWRGGDYPVKIKIAYLRKYKAVHLAEVALRKRKVTAPINIIK